MGQLLILGNGFDLACGLESSFQSFRKWRQSRIDINNLSDPDLNAFDVILEQHRGDLSQWADVESAMQALFVGEADHEPILDKIYAKPVAYSINLDGSESSTLYDSQNPLCQYSKSRMRLDKVPEKDDLVAFLRNELRRYEATFGEYLWQEVENKGEKYTSAAQDALIRLMEDNVLEESYLSSTSAVLSFNYTTPFSTSNPISNETRFYNIHGTLAKNNIIFGIDGQDIEESGDGMPFTKTYRLLDMSPLSYRSLVYPPDDENHEPTSCIKVYGHSLAKADYSYFQSLFDTVSLYSGVTTLVFYYSLYGDGESEQLREKRIREEMQRRAIHLLSSYGNTLDNKDHGKNLVHKLLLEGRLIIKKIDFT